jgi:hypothetical protein
MRLEDWRELFVNARHEMLLSWILETMSRDRAGILPRSMQKCMEKSNGQPMLNLDAST